MKEEQSNFKKFSPCEMCFIRVGHDYNPELCDGKCDYVDIVHERNILRKKNKMLENDLKKALNTLNM